MSKKTVQRLKIFGSLLFALVIVSYGAPQVFVAGTSQVRQDFIAGIKNLPTVAVAYISHPTDSAARTDQIETSQMPSEEKKQDLKYEKVREGVYAAEDPITKERIIKVDKGTVLEKRTVIINGREIVVYVPVK